MRGAVILSLLLHIAVILFAWFGLPSLSDRRIQPQQEISVAIVTDIEAMSPKPVAAPAAKPEPEPKPEPKPEPAKAPPKPVKPAALPEPPPPPPPPKDVVAIPKPPEPKDEPKPEPKEEPKAEPKPEPKEEPKAEPEPELKPEPEEVAKAEPKPAPRPRKKPKPPPEDEFASVLRTVEKLKDRPKPKPPEKTFGESIEDVLKKHAAKTPPQSQANRFGPKLSMSELDALRQQIERCWNPPAGAPEAENLVVEVKLQINPDGTVASAQIVDRARMYRDSFYRAAAESVLRAIKNPGCTPLRLPLGKYELWKDTTLIFDPRELVGR